MKLFGKDLFEKKLPVTLYDFAQHGILSMDPNYGQLAVWVDPNAEPKKKAPKKAAPTVTPKEVYQLKTLNIPDFALNCNDEYLDEQLSILDTKLELVGRKEPKVKKGNYATPTPYDPGYQRFGRMEIISMIERLNNRRRYDTVKQIYGEWPYTSNEAIRQVLSNHSNLEAKTAMDTIPDLPKEAVNAIRDYTRATEGLCGKKPVFYLISEKVERTAVSRRRDPILLAQSPFGFFWQILGAWDKEIVYLEEL